MTTRMANLGPEDDVPVWDANLVAIYVSPGHDYWPRKGEDRRQHGITELAKVQCVAGMGLSGDRYFGLKPDHKGQVTFMDADVVQAIRQQFELPHLPASVFRRNLLVRGVHLGDWLHRRFVFQGVEFEGSQECRPCQWMNRVVANGCEAWMREGFRGGLRARIKTDGFLRTSDDRGEANAPVGDDRVRQDK